MSNRLGQYASCPKVPKRGDGNRRSHASLEERAGEVIGTTRVSIGRVVSFVQ